MSHDFVANEPLLKRYSGNPIIHRDVIPCAALYDEGTGEVRVYYGGADTCVCLATCSIADLLTFIKENRFDD